LFGSSSFAHNTIINPAYLASGQGEIIWPIVGFAILLPLMARIATGLFSPVWFLLNGGIVFTIKKKVENVSDPIEIRSVGGWYLYLLKGYAGIGVIFTYALFLIDMLNRFADITNPGFWTAAIMLSLMPILVSIYLLPAILILDKIFNSRRKFIRNFANKLDIRGPLEHPLDIYIEQ
jgi:hypothetical protein